jgi:tripartite ATP-independent transporter DctM subunit
MSPLATGLVGFIALLVLIALRAPVGLALAVTGFAGLWVLHGLDTAVFVLSTEPVATLNGYTLSVLPLFLLMGSFAVRAGLSEGLFKAANAFVGHRPGGLAMASVVACGGFGAVCGSSLATVTTMAKISIPEMLRYNYSPKLAAGAIAAGGTLGILIPPSLVMIIYAFLTETSVGKLFAAGIIPGAIATLLYVVAVAVLMRFKPELGPAARRIAWRQRFATLREVWGVVALFALVMGGIFVGAFSPTEGAAVGAFGALVLGVATRRIDWAGFVACIKETMQVSAMIFFIVIGISIFDYFMQASRVPEELGTYVSGLQLSPSTIMAGIILFLVLLGCVMDSIAIVFLTTPFLFPIIVHLGYDPVWFGIVMVVIVEFGLITPPFGMNVFVISKMTPEVSTWGAFEGVVPFIASDIVRITLFLVFPGVVLWLPNLLYQ